MKKAFIIFLALFIFSGPQVFADETLTGLIPGQIWYSKDPFIEGDTIKIYTAIWNSGKDPLSVSVNFYDKNVILGTTEVAIPAESIKDASIFWKVTKGDHAISAKILSSTVSSGGKKRPVQLNRSSTEEDSIFVAASVKTADGTLVPSTDVAKNQLEKAVSVLPSSIEEPLLSGVGAVESFRENTNSKLESAIDKNQKIIDSIEKPDSAKEKTGNDTGIKAIDEARLVKEELGDTARAKDPLDAPMAHIKVFLFTSLAMIFGHRWVFYGLLAVILFLIIRTIYRKIRNR